MQDEASQGPGTLADPMGELARRYHVTAQPTVSGQDQVYYALVAAGYAATVPSGTPIKFLAKATGRTNDRIRHDVQRARDRGFLSASIQGVPHGSLTDLGRKVLGGK